MFKLFTFNLRPVKRRCKSPFRYDCRNYRPHHKQWCWAAFFRSMNRKIPHARDEHEGNNLTMFDSLIPGTVEHMADQGGHIVDVDEARAAGNVTVGSGSVIIGRCAQDDANEHCHIVDIHTAIAVHVTP